MDEQGAALPTGACLLVCLLHVNVVTLCDADVVTWKTDTDLSVSGSQSTAVETHEHDAVIPDNALNTTLVTVSG
jgi:hypothetical protein